MEWLEQLDGTVGSIDTAPLIYFIERNPSYVSVVRPFFLALAAGRFRVVTSVITLLECQVIPLRNGDHHTVRQYREILLESDFLTTIRVSEEIAEHAAVLRAKFGPRTPDALQLATAVRSSARWFLTNDKRLQPIPDLEVIVLDDLLTAQ